MKHNFEEPAIRVELFHVEDVVTDSGVDGIIIPGGSELLPQPIGTTEPIG